MNIHMFEIELIKFLFFLYKMYEYNLDYLTKSKNE